MTTNVLNTKISEGRNRIPVASYLVCKINYCTKILENDGRYITNSNHDKLMTEMTDARMKQKR